MNFKKIIVLSLAAFGLLAALPKHAVAHRVLPENIDLDREVTMAVVIYDQMELLDYAGPKEVFSNTSKLLKYYGHKGGFKVITVAENLNPIELNDGTRMTADYTFATVPKVEIIVVPGGVSDQTIYTSPVVPWLKTRLDQKQFVMSVCTGALLIAHAGFLDQKKATTHHLSLKQLKELAPTAQVLANRRYVLDDNILTTAGISAGIDGAFYLSSKYFGFDITQKLSTMMEYTWNQDSEAL